MRRLGRQSRKNRHMLNDLSLTPLIDTALTLLIIFMISAPMMNNSIKITLPKGKAKEETSSVQEMIVTVNKEGLLYLNDMQMNKEQLLVKIKETVQENSEHTIFVRADQAVSYGSVIELVDTLKTIGGVKYVALATSKYV